MEKSPLCSPWLVSEIGTRLEECKRFCEDGKSYSEFHFAPLPKKRLQLTKVCCLTGLTFNLPLKFCLLTLELRQISSAEQGKTYRFTLSDTQFEVECSMPWQSVSQLMKRRTLSVYA